MIKTKVWVIIFAVILIVCAAVIIITKNDRKTTAYIYQNGNCLYTINLSSIAEPYDITVKCDGGENIIGVENGRICVKSADCADKTCVNMGWSSGETIVCLPHKLVISFGKEREIDAAAR